MHRPRKTGWRCTETGIRLNGLQRGGLLQGRISRGWCALSLDACARSNLSLLLR